MADENKQPTTSEIAAAVRAERARCIAACRKVAGSSSPWSAAVEACADAIEGKVNP